jgi:hypothetical protein
MLMGAKGKHIFASILGREAYIGFYVGECPMFIGDGPINVAPYNKFLCFSILQTLHGMVIRAPFYL